MVAPPSYVAHGELLRKLDTECALAQPKRKGLADWLAIVRLIEWPSLSDRVGQSGCAELLEAVAGLIEKDIPCGDRVLHTDDGEIVLVIHGFSEAKLGRLFATLSRVVVNHHFMAGGEPVRVTPAIGFTAFGGSVWPRTALRCARMALDHSAAQLDLRPTAFSNILNKRPERWQEWFVSLAIRRGARFAMQLLAAMMIALVLPFVIYMELPDAIAMPLSRTMFVATLIVLILTATLINIHDYPLDIRRTKAVYHGA